MNGLLPTRAPLDQHLRAWFAADGRSLEV